MANTEKDIFNQKYIVVLDYLSQPGVLRKQSETQSSILIVNRRVQCQDQGLGGVRAGKEEWKMQWGMLMSWPELCNVCRGLLGFTRHLHRGCRLTVPQISLRSGREREKERCASSHISLVQVCSVGVICPILPLCGSQSLQHWLGNLNSKQLGAANSFFFFF